MNNILLSIIVPTKDRYQYLYTTIKSLLEINSSDIEIVVQDNSQHEMPKNVSELIEDKRVKYFKQPIPLSMSQNYEFALEKATGHYVCVIGDDDTVTQYALQLAKWAESHNIDAVVLPSLINYVWPDLDMGSGNLESGQLVIREFSLSVTNVDPVAELKKSLKRASQSFEKMPKLYYGIVSLKLLSEIKVKTGRYFPGVSPDMAAAVSISLHAKNPIFVDFPVFIPGSSANSNAGLSGLKKHIGWLNEQSHLDKDCEERWSEIVPRFYSVQTIWAEAAVEAIIANSKKNILKYLSISDLYAQCAAYHFAYYIRAKKSYRLAAKNCEQNIIVANIKLCTSFLKLLIRRARNIYFKCFKFVSLPNKNIYCKHSVNDIQEAKKMVEDFLYAYQNKLNLALASFKNA